MMSDQGIFSCAWCADPGAAAAPATKVSATRCALQCARCAVGSRHVKSLCTEVWSRGAIKLQTCSSAVASQQGFVVCAVADLRMSFAGQFVYDALRQFPGC